MMKKFLSLMLAALMIFSGTYVAFATEECECESIGEVTLQMGISHTKDRI